MAKHAENRIALELETLVEDSGRRIWDPARSSLVDETIERLVSLYQDGTLRHELRPSTLLALGEDFEKFFHAAFKIGNRPAWAITRYPLGFESLVLELNEKLGKSGVKLLNTRQNHNTADRLNEKERVAVYDLQDLYGRGIITRTRALGLLESEFDVSLSPSQANYYFPVEKRSSDLLLSEQKAALLEKIEKFKKTLDLDFALRSCLEGLLFESFVGVVLRDLSSDADLQRQVSLPLLYTDLNGTPRTSVRPDFVVLENDKISSGIYEAKLLNHHDNLLSSALAQFCAVNAPSNKEKTKINIIYRNPNAFFSLAISDNMTVDQELRKMGLDDAAYGSLQLNQVVNYLSITSLVQRSENREILHALLEEVDCVAKSGDLRKIRAITDWMIRISSVEDQRSERIALAVQMSRENVKLSSSESRRMFGPRERSVTVFPMEAIAAVRADRTLMRLYQTLFQEPIDEITSEAITRIESVTEDQLIEACFSMFVESLDSIEERNAFRSSRNEMRAFERDLLNEYETLRARLDSETLDKMREVIQTSVRKLVQWKNDFDASFPYKPQGGTILPLQFDLSPSLHQKLSRMERIPPYAVTSQHLRDLQEKLREIRVSCFEGIVINMSDTPLGISHEVWAKSLKPQVELIAKDPIVGALKRGMKKLDNQRRLEKGERDQLTMIISILEGKDFQIAFNCLSLAARTSELPTYRIRNSTKLRIRDRSVTALQTYMLHCSSIADLANFALALEETYISFVELAEEKLFVQQLRKKSGLYALMDSLVSAPHGRITEHLSTTVANDVLNVSTNRRNLWDLYTRAELREDAANLIDVSPKLAKENLNPSILSMELCAAEDAVLSARLIAFDLLVLISGDSPELVIQNGLDYLNDVKVAEVFYSQLSESGTLITHAIRAVVRERLEQAKLLCFISPDIAKEFLEFDLLTHDLLDLEPDVAFALLSQHLERSDKMFEGLLK